MSIPVTYRIDAERRTIYTRCFGHVTLAEVIGHFDQLEPDPLRTKPLDVLLDLTEVTSLPAASQLRTVAARVDRMDKGAFGLCAIVVRRLVLYGLARMFAVFAEAHFDAVAVFRDPGEAQAWLISERQPAG